MHRMPSAVVEMEIDVAAGPEAEGARRATAASGPVATSRAPDPDPEVPAKVQRRRFTAEYRRRIARVPVRRNSKLRDSAGERWAGHSRDHRPAMSRLTAS